MTPRRPHLLPVLPALALALAALAGCGGDPVTAQDGSEPTPSVTEETEAEPSLLPDDLALDIGLHRGDADATIDGPGRDVAALSFADLCAPDPTVWPGSSTDRLTVVESGPEYALAREALLFGSEEAADRALAGLTAQVASCDRDGDRVYVRQEPTDASTLTFGMHYTEGLGGGTWQLTRVGRTLLVVHEAGEYSAESLPGGARSTTETTATVLDAVADDLP